MFWLHFVFTYLYLEFIVNFRNCNHLTLACQCTSTGTHINIQCTCNIAVALENDKKAITKGSFNPLIFNIKIYCTCRFSFVVSIHLL